MRTACAIVLILCVGCGKAEPAFAVVVRSAVADGTKSQPLASESTLTAGAQGGFHVWLDVRFTGAKAERTRVKHTVRRKSDGVLFSTGERTLDVGAAGPEGFWESSPAWPAFLCPSPLGINILGEPAVIKLEVSTVDGTLLGTAEANTQFSCPAAQQAFCESICRG